MTRLSVIFIGSASVVACVGHGAGDELWKRGLLGRAQQQATQALGLEYSHARVAWGAAALYGAQSVLRFGVSLATRGKYRPRPVIGMGLFAGAGWASYDVRLRRDVKGIQAELVALRQEMVTGFHGMHGRFNRVDGRFDEMGKRFDGLQMEQVHEKLNMLIGSGKRVAVHEAEAVSKHGVVPGKRVSKFMFTTGK